MKRRILDLTDHIEQNLLDDSELSEQEIQALTADIRLDQIHKRALRAIRPHKSSRVKQFVLIAAAAALVGTTVLAASQWDVIKTFWGEHANLPKEELMPAGQSASDNGVTMRVEGVVNGGAEIMAFVSFRKEDGGSFQKEELPVMMDMDGGHSSAVIGHRLSDDGKTLFYSFEAWGDEKNSLHFSAKDFYLPKLEHFDTQLPLAAAFGAAPSKITLKQDQTQDSIGEEFLKATEPQRKLSLPSLPREKEYPAIRFAGVGYVDGDLVIGLFTAKDDPDGRFASISALRDVRTGVEYPAKYYQSCEIPEQTDAMLYFSHFGKREDMPENDPEHSKYKAIATEDLEYLVPVITYHSREYTVKGNWKLEVPVSQAGTSFDKQIDIRMEKQGEDIRLNKISVSPMGVCVSGQVIEEDGTVRWGLPKYTGHIKLTLNDGKVLYLVAAGGSSNQNGFIWEYALESGEPIYWKSLIQPDQVVSISLDETVIPRG